MAIRQSVEWSQASGSHGQRGTQITDIIAVESDAMLDPATALATVQTVPAPGRSYPARYLAPHSTSPWLSCREVRIAQITGPNSVKIAAEYSNDAGGEWNMSPMNQPPIRQWGWMVSQEPMQVDFDGVPVANTVGVPFNPPLTVEVRDPVCTINDNVANWDVERSKAYQDAVNNDWFWGNAPGQCKITEIVAAEQRQSGWRYWQRRIQIAFRALRFDSTGMMLDPKYLWLRRVANTSLYEKVPGKNGDYDSLRRIKEQNTGRPISEPVMIDRDGQQIYNPQDCVWLYFRFVQEAAFAALGLGQAPT